jgi:hypothetical protein
MSVYRPKYRDPKTNELPSSSSRDPRVDPQAGDVGAPWLLYPTRDRTRRTKSIGRGLGSLNSPRLFFRIFRHPCSSRSFIRSVSISF